jgi:hypothetical protein
MSGDQAHDLYEAVRPALEALAALNAARPWGSTR